MLNLKVLACGLAIGSMSMVAVAQGQPKDKAPAKQPAGDKPAGDKGGQPRGERGPGGMMGGEPLSAEKAKAAWDLQAGSVAKRLGLNADQTKALTKAYEDARTSQQSASEKLRKDQREKMKDMDQEDRRDAMQAQRKAMEDLNKSEREKFSKAVSTAVSGENGTKAVNALGSFNPMWDRMVDSIAGLKLEDAKQAGALNTIEEYVAAQTKAMAGGPDADPQDRREAMMAAREKLTTDLKKNLTEDQIKKFEESMPGGGRGQGGGGGRGRGQGGGGGGEKGDK